MATKPILFLALALWLSPAPEETSAFRLALESAERALTSGDHVGARSLLERALERDRKSIEAWDLRARLAEAVEDPDEVLYCRHQEYRLSLAQGLGREEMKALRERLENIDPLARELLGMKDLFLDKLRPIAARYEKEGRPHAAIRVLKKILALDPEDLESQQAIDRVASAPDPSLAENAKPKDLFADVSEEWIREYDVEHSSWDDRAKLERENYTTYTDAGYEVLVRTGEAMEQMNAFYRRFFKHGTEEHGGSVSPIGINIFRNREEYLELGIGPPIEWSGGHFTGSFVETYIGTGGFNGMVGTLFHEAAHQFVSLATNASGWLNEGLASFFEGTRILPNGTVIMNMPATHRLVPLADRMERGWMADEKDGTDPNEPNKTPEKAPTFRIVLENRYSWGPPWYAPTWGVVYFLYNYQDPVDGRFIYRDAFSIFIDKSGGRVGEGAVKNFEEVVLANPSKPLKGVEPLEGAESASLPQNVEALNEVWKEWMLELRARQLGTSEETPPYQLWGRYAAANKQYETAKEHFEKGLVAQPDDIELLMEFADLLTKHFDNSDRGAKLVLEAIHYMERLPEPDVKDIRTAERLLEKLDPKRKTLSKLMDDMHATSRGILTRYLAADRPMMAMDVAWRLSTTLELEELLTFYEDGLRRSGKSLHIWDLAYNEQDLTGWAAQGPDPVFTSADTFLEAEFGEFAEDNFDYRILTLDKVTSGDFSMQAEVQAQKGKINYCGFVFGHKSAQTFHGLMLFPGKSVAAGVAETGFIDLMSSYGGSTTKTWRHVPVETTPSDARSSAGLWHTLRLDVSGRLVDIWFNGTLLATHEFPSLDVLRGNFGLVCGRGEARFRNVRYLARDARDPAGKLERDVRMQALKAKGGGAVGGSYQGVVPPWPKIKRWVQGKRTSWDELGNVPQLLVFFSTQQNDMVRIDTWLSDLAQRMKKTGLEIVCIASVNDADKIEAYLESHPMPGAVAVDDRKGVGIGESFEQFHIRRFNLPRLLLLDLDHTVAWEGDPGFSMGSEWGGEESFLAAPLADLIDKRKLEQLGAWKRAWKETALPALHAGDPAPAVEVLFDSREFDKRFAPQAGQAQNSLGALEAAFDALESAAATFQRDGADPALGVLIDWAPLFERKVTPRDMKMLKPVSSSKVTKNWTSAVKACGRFVKRRGTAEEKADELLGLLEGFEGMFVRRLEEAFVAARDAGDEESMRRLAGEAAEMPRLWLAREYFGW